MKLIVSGLCLVLFTGCSPESVSDAVDRGADVDNEDGGTVKNADREKAQAFFTELAKVQTVEEEEKLLADFGEWLEGKDYKIQVTEKNGKHNLSCPYFPPVTPWTEHLFFDIKNLELLPRLDNGG